MYDENDNTVVEAHIPCPDCGSSDAMCRYSDGHTYCFSCEAHHFGEQTEEGDNKCFKVARDVIAPSDLLLEPLPARKLTMETCRRYGYYKGFLHNRKAQFANYVDDDGTIIGQKVRYADKTFEILGKLHNRFFGQHLYPGGSSKLKLVITEGEIDCLTVSQLQGNKYPVVSLPNGAKSARKTFEAQYDWLESFSEVILMFDMDKPGRDAVKEVCGILSPGKIKIATLPCKDPNECLLQGKAQEVINAIWNAKPYKPSCIINGVDLWETLRDEKEEAFGFPLPWDIDLQKMTMGIRKGELILITAGTGTGKTTFVRQLAHHFGVSLDLKVGMLMLEENVKRTAKGIMSVHTGKRLALNRNLLTEEEYKRAFDETLGSGRFVLYEHFGSLESEDLIHNIRYMSAAENCDFIILDHISIAISGLDIENERKATDVLMTRLRSLVEETGVGMLVISHLKRVDGTPAEEGGTISLSHLRGSQALSQLSDGVWALERNQQADDKGKNLVRIRILKGRYTGETGIAGYLAYDKETDRLEAVENIKEYNEEPMEIMGDCDDLKVPF